MTELVVPMVLICVILNIAISIFWGSGLLLSDTNIDSVLALPIPLRTLILSKLTVLFMVEVALTVALLLPMMVLFGLTAGMGFPFYLIVLGITILFPVIPGLLGTMFGTQIYRILKNSSARIARLKAAAAILILFAFMIFMFCKFPDIAAGNFGDVISTSTFTLYAGQYIHRLLNGDYLLIGIYFGGVFLIGVTLLYGLIKIFRNWYSNDAIQGSKSQPVDWNKQTTKQHSPVSALLERERTRYFSLPVYLTNTACGLLFAAVFVLLVVLMSDKITPYIYQLAEYFQVPFADYDVLFIYAFSILTTISCTTYVSISIEGKQIEILKSLPIAAKCLFRVKLLHHLSMSVPTIFVLNTIMALYLQWSFPKAMLGYAFPLLCSVLIGMIGYILNLIFPNFEWENTQTLIETQPPISSVLFRQDGADIQQSTDEGKTWQSYSPIEETDYFTYDEFSAWIENETENIQKLVDAGEWTEAEATEALEYYDEILKSILEGKMVGKRASSSDDQLFFSMPDNAQPEQYQTFVFDGNTYKSIGPFDTEEELFNALKEYTDTEVEAGTMSQAEATALLEKYQ